MLQKRRKVEESLEEVASRAFWVVSAGNLSNSSFDIKQKFNLDLYSNIIDDKLNLTLRVICKRKGPQVKNSEIDSVFNTLFRLLNEDRRYGAYSIRVYFAKSNQQISIEKPYPDGWLRLGNTFHKNSIVMHVEIICSDKQRENNDLRVTLKKQDHEDNDFDTGFKQGLLQMYCAKIKVQSVVLGTLTYSDLLTIINEHNAFQEGSFSMINYNKHVARMLRVPERTPPVIPFPQKDEFLFYEICPKFWHHEALDDKYGLGGGQYMGMKISDLPSTYDENHLSILVFACPSDMEPLL
jgi:hypothetical protein